MGLRLDFIIGCTGCGKAAVGHALARALGAEIISVDAMKVYRRMDIGTAKPGPARRAEVPYHLIDVVEPGEPFSVGRFRELAEAAIADITARGRRILLVGGTSLYLKSLSEGLFDGPAGNPEIRARIRARAAAVGAPQLHAELQQVDPDTASRVHPNDLRRIERALEVYEITGTPISRLQTQWDHAHPAYDCSFIGLRRAREDQNHRINQRVRRMMDEGLLDEVRRLLDEPLPLSVQARQALGYAELIDHLDGRLSLDDAVERIKINTRRFAKSQRTWHRRFSGVQWYDLDEDADLNEVAQRILPLLQSP